MGKMVIKRKKSIQKLKKDNLLIIFTRNPELGKCKTRLAATIGDHAALEVYMFLLDHTAKITKDLKVDKEVHYSNTIGKTDIWDTKHFTKKVQYGNDLGERMENAFADGFSKGYKNIVIIGSDIYELEQKDIEIAFTALASNQYVIGPAKDGGYYLLGMNTLHPKVFKNKDWGTKTVLKDTLGNLPKNNLTILEERNDVDFYEDIKDVAVFQKFLKDDKVH